MKIKPTGNTAIDAALRRARSALVRLDGTADRAIARRNARRRALTALRGVRAAMDREYPAIMVRRTSGSRLTTFEGKLARAEAAGWRQTDVRGAAAFGSHGIRVRRVSGVTRSGTRNTVLMVPDWALAIGSEKPAQLARARRSLIERRAALAAAGLLAHQTSRSSSERYQSTEAMELGRKIHAEVQDSLSASVRHTQPSTHPRRYSS